MSEEEVMVVGISDNEVRNHLAMVSGMLGTVLGYLPEFGVSGKVKKVGQAIISLTQHEWFVGLVTYIINKFQGGDVDQESLSNALSEYAQIVSVPQPVAFNKPV